MASFLDNISARWVRPILTDGLQRVEELLTDTVIDTDNITSDIVSYLAKAGGKRLRPALTIVSSLFPVSSSYANNRLHANLQEDNDSKAENCKKNTGFFNKSPINIEKEIKLEKNLSKNTPNQYIKNDTTVSNEVIVAAVACELTHIASLYHDDVMDLSDLRRGVPTVHTVWDNSKAILAGDVLFARSSKLMVSLGLESAKHHSETFERLCYGQLCETYGPSSKDDPVEFYLQVLADKTGSLLATSAYLGAMHAGVGSEILAALYSYAETLGVAFQLADDVIDIVSASSVSGKQTGVDLKHGVVTMPLLLLQDQLKQGSIDARGRQILGLFIRILEYNQQVSNTNQFSAYFSPSVLAAMGVSLQHHTLTNTPEAVGNPVVLERTQFSYPRISTPAELDTAVGQTVDLLRKHPVIEETRQLARKKAEEAKSHLHKIEDYVLTNQDHKKTNDILGILSRLADYMVDRSS